MKSLDSDRWELYVRRRRLQHRRRTTTPSHAMWVDLLNSRQEKSFREPRNGTNSKKPNKQQQNHEDWWRESEPLTSREREIATRDTHRGRERKKKQNSRDITACVRTFHSRVRERATTWLGFCYRRSIHSLFCARAAAACCAANATVLG